MGNELPVLTSLEGHAFSYKERQYSIETATATRRQFDEVTRGTGAPVDLHFTVTSPGNAKPIGVLLHLSPENAADLGFVRSALEDAVAKIVDGKTPPRDREHL
jgi:hypothetical protein